MADLNEIKAAFGEMEEGRARPQKCVDAEVRTGYRTEYDRVYEPSRFISASGLPVGFLNSTLIEQDEVCARQERFKFPVSRFLQGFKARTIGPAGFFRFEYLITAKYSALSLFERRVLWLYYAGWYDISTVANYLGLSKEAVVDILEEFYYKLYCSVYSHVDMQAGVEVLLSPAAADDWVKQYVLQYCRENQISTVGDCVNHVGRISLSTKPITIPEALIDGFLNYSHAYQTGENDIPYLVQLNRVYRALTYGLEKEKASLIRELLYTTSDVLSVSFVVYAECLAYHEGDIDLLCYAYGLQRNKIKAHYRDVVSHLRSDEFLNNLPEYHLFNLQKCGIPTSMIIQTVCFNENVFNVKDIIRYVLPRGGVIREADRFHAEIKSTEVYEMLRDSVRRYMEINTQ